MANPTQLKVLAGSKALDLPKGTILDVVSVTQLGPEYSHSVRLVLRVVGSRLHARQLGLYARHINRVGEKSFNLNNGNPLKKVTVGPA